MFDNMFTYGRLKETVLGDVNLSFKRIVFIIVLGVSFVALALALAIVLGVEVSKSKNAGKDVCSSSDCLRVAGYIASNLNTSIDPCDDFYTYSCGGWMSRNFIKPESVRLDVHQLIRQSTRDKLESLLTRKISDGAPGYEKKLKILYQSCMDELARAENHDTEIKKRINNTIGGWYGFDPTILNNWDFEKSLVASHDKLNLWGVLVRPWMSKKFTGSKQFTIRLYDSSLVLSSGRYYAKKLLSPKNKPALKTYIQTIGTLLMGGKADTQRLNTFVQDVVNLELQIAKAVNKSLWRNPRTTTIGELEKNRTTVPWKKLLTASFGDVNKASDSQEVVIVKGNYFDLQEKILTDLGTNKSRVLNNFLVFRFASVYANALSSPYRIASTTFAKAVNARYIPKTLAGHCYKMLRTFYMRDALAAEYIKYYFHDDDKAKADQLFEDVRMAASSSIDNIPWMDEDTKKKAFVKMDSVVDVIGYPAYLRDVTFMENQYKDVSPENGLIQNLLNLKGYLRPFLKKLVAADSKMDAWTIAPQYTYTTYSYWRNAVIVTAGNLQPPLYWNISTPPVKYGGTGHSMGQQIFKSIDEEGRFFDVHGEYNKDASLWTSNTLNKIKEAKKCVADFYSKHTAGPYDLGDKGIKMVKVSGERSLRSAVPYTAGIRIAFNALKNKESRDGKSLRLIGLNLSNDQLFFVAAAQRDCRIETPEYAFKRVSSYKLVPNKIKVNAAMQQLDEFQRAFSCSKNSKMNAKRKCGIF